MKVSRRFLSTALLLSACAIPTFAAALTGTAQRASSPSRPLLGAEVTLAEWRKAENRSACAPLAFSSNGGAPGTPKGEAQSGGWRVAFDIPGTSSAYGVAGTWLRPDIDTAEKLKRAALWGRPYTRDLGRPGGLPPGSIAGYGIGSFSAYSRDNPLGQGLRSLAYVWVPGQSCM
ncbi:MAG TPA: hypothetical protein VGD10_00130 [Allosphingosinicella sp.]|uniref:hypothetical protein n=1 Tax=Allosphingosinicella sp. TaxID=2823234 RepID=UPI002EDA4FAC